MNKKIISRLLMAFALGLMLQACSTHHHTVYQYNRGRQKSAAFLLNKQGPGAHWANKRERYSPID
ncbi:MAG: hypothetical protein ACK478_00895 [Flavobacteriales bacterium]|jgi:hypothetical protein